MDTISKGRLGYNLLEKALLKRDWDIYIPVLENTKVDCIIVKEDVLIKIQIKLLYNGTLPVRKISHNQGEYKVHHYSKNEVDFFVGVDIETEDLYIVPISVVEKYKSSIGKRVLQQYKNNFSLMEPCRGNLTSEEDDIGESLTANAEGMDE